ncbi:glycosyltransferase family 9 protein [Actinotalea sp. Marseille-Q4924]|uniref:glycosyltransferase family 9 protein n=1 Tax=Actinotalea sp. Marseille-Q4924 TaxID=2866571 RepID=UPI001CE48B1B|nr:glycosyltransferase family 9 protein [Actinotalea sp. Marseille-Q4924]
MSDAASAPATVLVLRALGLGDALTGVPALRGLRRAFPDHRLVLAAPAGLGGWLRDLGVVDAVLPASGVRAVEPLDPALVAEVVGGPPAVAVNLHGRGPQSHRVLAATEPGRLLAFAADGFPDGPAWDEDEHEVERWCRLVRATTGASCGPEDLRLDLRLDPRPDLPAAALRAEDGDGAVVLHPGAASGSRRWPADRWAHLADRLVRAGRRVVVTGGSDEIALAESLVLGLPAERAVVTAGRLDLPGLADVVARAALVVCGDTGVAHVATAAGTSSVLLFGPTPPHRWGPATDVARHRVLHRGDPDRPGDPHGDEPDPALLALTLDEVHAAVEEMLTT